MNERSYPAGWSNFCKVICTGANGLGYELVLVLNWDPPFCVCLPLCVCVGAGKRRGLEGRGSYLIVLMVRRHCWYMGAKDARYHMVLKILCYTVKDCFMPRFRNTFFFSVHLASREGN